MNVNRTQTCETCGTSNDISEQYCTNCNEILKGVSQGETEETPVSSPPPLVVQSQPPFLAPDKKKQAHSRSRPLFILFLICLVLAVYFIYPLLSHILFPPQSPSNQCSVKLSNGPTSLPTGIGKDGMGLQCVGGEYLGLSDGGFPLDLLPGRNPGTLDQQQKILEWKIQASESLREQDYADAETNWSLIHRADSSDAEPLIYQENLSIASQKHITVVVGVLLGNTSQNATSRDILQGAYAMQKMYNDDPNNADNPKIRLVIAKSGSNPNNVSVVAKQIIEAQKKDSTIVGVLGWANSTTSLNAIRTFAASTPIIPMVVPTATEDSLTNPGNFVFRVTSPNVRQAEILANYTDKTLHPQQLVILSKKELYSQGLKNDFIQDIPTSIDIKGDELYENNLDAKTALAVLNKYKPDVLFLATNNATDIATLLNTIPDTEDFKNLKVLTGDSAIQLSSSLNSIKNTDRLYASGTADIDAWKVLGFSAQKPPFFSKYPDFFSLSSRQDLYGYTIPSGFAMLGYDGLYTLIAASPFLAKDQGPEAFITATASGLQGTTGVIQLGKDGNPIKKMVYIFTVIENNQNKVFHIKVSRGCLSTKVYCDDTTTYF